MKVVLLDSISIEAHGPADRPTKANKNLHTALTQLDWERILRKELTAQGLDLKGVTFSTDAIVPKKKPATPKPSAKPQPYNVEVSRIGYATRTLVVNAKTSQEAADAALGMAGGESFSEHSSDYEVLSVSKA